MDYTQDLLDFDDDAGLYMHISRLTLDAAHELNELEIQADIINHAGIIRYGGDATSNATMTGDTGSVASVINYSDLIKGSIDLDDNKTPKQTTLVNGSRNIATQTISAGRLMYVGSELMPMLRAMKDYHNNPAFKELHEYDHGSKSKALNGEEGQIGQFRVIVVPDMIAWRGGGAAVGTNGGYRATAGKYDVLPMLVVGDESFATINFKISKGKKPKFTLYAKKPGYDIADMDNPYGSEGFISLQWWYGYLNLRPERILLMKTVAAT